MESKLSLSEWNAIEFDLAQLRVKLLTARQTVRRSTEMPDSTQMELDKLSMELGLWQYNLAL